MVYLLDLCKWSTFKRRCLKIGILEGFDRDKGVITCTEGGRWRKTWSGREEHRRQKGKENEVSHQWKGQRREMMEGVGQECEERPVDREKHDIDLCLCVFFRRGVLRRCAGTRSWEKKWQREKPQQVLRLTPPQTPSSTTMPQNPEEHPLSPPFPPHAPAHLSTPPPLCHTPPYYYETTTAWDATPRQWEVQMGLGGWTRKSKNNLKKRKINVSHPLFPKENVFALFQMRRKEKKIKLTSDSGYWFL